MNSVLNDPVGTSFIVAKNASPAVQTRGDFNCTAKLRIPPAKNFEAIKAVAKRVVSV